MEPTALDGVRRAVSAAATRRQSAPTGAAHGGQHHCEQRKRHPAGGSERAVFGGVRLRAADALVEHDARFGLRLSHGPPIDPILPVIPGRERLDRRALGDPGVRRHRHLDDRPVREVVVHRRTEDEGRLIRRGRSLPLERQPRSDVTVLRRRCDRVADTRLPVTLFGE